MITVPGYGRLPSSVLLCGEAPGETEATEGRPFVGRSGAEQDAILARFGLSTRAWYLTNVVKEYIDGNPDPTPIQVAYWLPSLIKEVNRCQPKLIICVGRFAAQRFLGEEATLEICHGIPLPIGYFDSKLKSVFNNSNAVVLSVTHPASMFYGDDNQRDKSRMLVNWDYSQIPIVLDLISKGTLSYPTDTFEGNELYTDVTGHELKKLIIGEYNRLAIDTEGDDWSIQVCEIPGESYLLRRDQSDFHVGIDHLRQIIYRNNLICVGHNWMHDLPVCLTMSLDLYDPDIVIDDTMYDSYLLKVEPQGLKPLSCRRAGMRMKSHEETVGVLGIERQLGYLYKVARLNVPPPGEQITLENDGTVSISKPRSISYRAAKIIEDVESGKLNKDGEPTDPIKRWKDIDRYLRRPVELAQGPMPIGSMAALYDKDKDAAIYYACRDADATLRDQGILHQLLRINNLESLSKEGCYTIPCFSEMQSNGMPVDVDAFKSLYEYTSSNMARLQSYISKTYYQSKPFNPGSPIQVASLARRQGLHGKRTKTGQMSTSQKSLGHHRYTNDAMASVFEWREYAKVRDAFCTPVIEMAEDLIDSIFIKPPIKITRVHTRRIASYLLTIPSRKEIGHKVRDCYICPDGYVIVTVDYKTLEMRVAAHISNDVLMCSLIKDGRDIHTEAAARMFGVSIDAVTKLQRYAGKTTGFGILFGLSALGLLDQFLMNGVLDYTETDCNRFINGWLDTYSGIKEEIKQTRLRLLERTSNGRLVNPLGIICDYSGMMRYLPGIHSTDKKIAAEAARMAFSHKVQGTAQTMIQRAMAYLRPIIYSLQQIGEDIKPLLQYHDELLYMCREEFAPTLVEIISDAFENHSGVELSVPVESDSAIAKSWGGAK